MKVEGKLGLILHGVALVEKETPKGIRVGSKNSPHHDLKFPPEHEPSALYARFLAWGLLPRGNSVNVYELNNEPCFAFGTECRPARPRDTAS